MTLRSLTRSTEKEGSMDSDSDWGDDFVVDIKGMESDHEEVPDKDELDTSGKKSMRRKYMNSEMLSYKQQGSYELPEDVYSFITVAPVCSAPFLFAVAVIGTKYIVYATLLSGLKFSEFSIKIDYDGPVIDGLSTDEIIAIAVKFLLVPVTVAMQEDLMAVYAGVANTKYDPKVKEISEAATRHKWALAYLLQLIDGLLSLTVNFLKMFNTPNILDVFLNFAALHFLQDIDDVFYALVEKGFFGDDMEHMANVCKQISWPRRTGTTEFGHFLASLDSTLFSLTFLICVALYILITYILIKSDA